MKELIARECQDPMIDIITRTNRCNVFASPGTGKTSATLMALDIASIVDGDVWPCLITAPKRVAQGVWLQELEAWSRFKGLRMSRVLGSAKEREAALKVPADIYVINYANLDWLHQKQGTKWPYKTVVADESTLIKGHRCHFRLKKDGSAALFSGGTKGASALCRHAPFTNRWINLTGTPTPNGVKDLWGQQWPIDFGKALERTHSAFSQRWFRMAWGSTREQQRLEPLEHAQTEIIERIKPYTALIDAYDYFDIERPVELDVMIELPSNVRSVYNEVHRESIAEIMDFKVKAVNAGAKVMKCRQIASGGVLDTDGNWQTLHKEKLAAVDEIRQKLNGAPVLVAYWFKHDLKALVERFKDAVVMPSDNGLEAVQDRWNAGKIPMLLIHSQGASHGLSLQHGGNNLIIYTMDWNAEYYEQVIERIGPTRQAQAGYKRLTYVHRLIADKTWEKVIAESLKKKMSTSEMVKYALAL